MKFFETSKYYSLKKSTYITLRWIAILGQLISINLVYFYFNFEFDFIISNIIVFLGILSNLYLIFINNKTQLSDRSALLFLTLDISQLGFLVYLTGGVINPFIIFLLIPSVFASTNLGLRTNLSILFLTTFFIIFLTFFSKDLPKPLSDHFHVSPYYYYAIPISLIIALLFLNYFAIIFGSESRLRKQALNKMEEIMAKEHEMLSLGGQAAAAAHSLGTPLSTIKIITQELMKQLKDQKDLLQDIAENSNLDTEEFKKFITSQEAKDLLIKNTDELIGRGGFGSPTFFYNGKMFFGNDRLHLLEEAITKNLI